MCSSDLEAGRHAHKQPRLEIIANFELKVAIFQRFPLAKLEEAATKPNLDLPNVPLFADHSVLDYGICVWRWELAACLHSVTDACIQLQRTLEP